MMYLLNGASATRSFGKITHMTQPEYIENFDKQARKQIHNFEIYFLKHLKNLISYMEHCFC
jgi:hypothetical protein